MIRKVVSIVMISALVLTGFVSCLSAPEEKEEKEAVSTVIGMDAVSYPHLTLPTIYSV